MRLLLRLPNYRTWFLMLILAFVVCASQAGALVSINELVSSNGSTLRDDEGDFPDWFELFNRGDAPADLEGYGLSDDPAKPFKWRLHNAYLTPGKFMVVFADGKDRQPEPVTPLFPMDVPGLVGWLAADGVDPDNSEQVRTEGDNLFVRKWHDYGPDQNDASQPASANQPLLIGDALNGYPVLRFDGLNDGLVLARVPATNSFTLVAVFRPGYTHEIDLETTLGTAGWSGQHWLFGPQNRGGSDAGAGLSAGQNGLSVYEQGDNHMPALAVYAGPVGSPWAVATITYVDKRPTIALQGAPVRTGAQSLRAQVTAPVEIGTGSYGSFNGDIAEVLVFNRALSTEERHGIEHWLGEKYALPVTLPKHASFNLSAQGESLVLTAPNSNVVDRVDFGPIPRDVSWGRRPDGTGTWLLFPEPTPGAANLTPAAAALLGSVEFSVKGGFYSNAVQLALSVPNAGATIRYTLDGSEPTESSPAYSAPLALGSRVGTANELSVIPTISNWPPPEGEVFKGWVVRARAFKAGALSPGVVTHSYFITPSGRARYSVPVVSLSTDRTYFFDPAIGIYVPGNTGANYSQRGPEWEHPVFVELFETNGNRALAQEAAVSIHGNTSQNFPIKGVDLDSKGGRGRGPFRYRIFPDRDRDSFENFLLRPSGHDYNGAFMRDEMMQSLMAETGAEHQAARPCVVFLNGEYWGLHYLKEKEDTEFIAYTAGRAKSEVDYLEWFGLVRDGDTVRWDELNELLLNQNPATAAVYQRARELMEVENYADYKISEIYTYRWDMGNHRCWRPRIPEGRFRWLQFDYDVGWGSDYSPGASWEFNMLDAVLRTDGTLDGHNIEIVTRLLRRLLENPDFKRDFINRACDLMNTIYLPSHAIERINGMAAVLEPEMPEHVRRWRAPVSVPNWAEHLGRMRTFANLRPGFMRQHFRAKFNLANDFTLRAAVAPTAGGRLLVNRVSVSQPTNAPWSGIYFRNHPLPLVAEPAPGYRFAGWIGAGASTTTNRIWLQATGDLSVTALFEPATLKLVVTPGPTGLQFGITGSPDATVLLERSDNLTSWTLERSLKLDAQGQGSAEASPAGTGGFFRLRIP